MQDGEKKKGGDKTLVWWGSKRVKDGREGRRDIERKARGTHPHAGVLTTKCWMNCLPSALTIANKGQRKRGGREEEEEEVGG